jgi:hypothetical protein
MSPVDFLQWSQNPRVTSCDVRHSLVRGRPIRSTGAHVRSAIAARRRHRLRDSTISRSFRGPQTASHRHPDHLRRKRYRLGAALNLRSVPIGTTVSRGSALKPGRAVWLREASANVPACAPRPLRKGVETPEKGRNAGEKLIPQGQAGGGGIKNQRINPEH